MSKKNQFIESICFKNGKYQLLEFHQQRVDRTFASFFEKPPINLLEVLPRLTIKNEIYKVRVCYSAESIDVEYANYSPRIISSIRLVATEQFDYSYKYQDRSVFNDLLKKSNSDEIIITVDGNVTDASYANLAFWDGCQWLTPDTPLLNGVKRQFLIKQGLIKEERIGIANTKKFEKVSLINAMLDLGEVELEVGRFTI